MDPASLVAGAELVVYIEYIEATQWLVTKRDKSCAARATLLCGRRRAGPDAGQPSMTGPRHSAPERASFFPCLLTREELFVLS